MPTKAQKTPVKGTYQHFNGGFYEVLGIAEEPETGPRYVVYEASGVSVAPAEGARAPRDGEHQLHFLPPPTGEDDRG
jgi:hypothetical protein